MSELSNRQEDDHKSPERLEHEADEVRARLNRTVDELSSRLSPGELLDQGLRMLREHGGEIGRNLGSQVKDNPVPLLLTTIGVSWLMMSATKKDDEDTSSGRYASDTYQRSYERRATRRDRGYVSAQRGSEYDTQGGTVSGTVKNVVDNAMDSAKETVGGALDSARSALHATSDRIGDYTSAMKDEMSQRSAAVRTRAQDATQSLSGLVYDQPLIVGTLGIALGAALGAMLPSTTVEDRLFGEARDGALERAKSMASEGYERVKEKAAEVADEIVPPPSARTEGAEPRPERPH